MGKPKITMYIDIISPFSYLGYYMLRHHPIFQSVEITYIPILLGGLFRLCNNQPPIAIKNKGKWIDNERVRWAKQFNIPVLQKSPEPFPFPTVTVMRSLCWLQSTHPGKLMSAADALYERVWAEGKGETDINKPEVLMEVLSGVLGKEEASKAVKMAGDESVKKLLSDNTEQAFADGAFGLPWFVCENGNGEKEGFWGFDRLGQVVRFLGLEQAGEDGQGSAQLRALM